MGLSLPCWFYLLGQSHYSLFVQGACEEQPPVPEAPEGSSTSAADPNYVRRPSQCVISVPSMFLNFLGEGGAAHLTEGSVSQVQQGRRSRKLLQPETSARMRGMLAAGSDASVLWIADLLIQPQGRLEAEWAGSGTSAVIEVEGADVWMTGVSVIGNTGACITCMNRALSVKNGRVYSRGIL